MSLLHVAGHMFRRPTAAALARQTLDEVAAGALRKLPVSIRFWDGSLLPGHSDPDLGEPPTVVLRRPRAISHLLYAPGELGLSRAFVDGSLTTDDDLERLLTLRGSMRALSLSRADRARLLWAAIRAAGLGVLRRPPVPTIEAGPSDDGAEHSLTRDREAIHHHYDVSNEFYELVLGPTMVYSCAYYDSPEDTLEEAQRRKLDVICRKLDLQPGERFLDIGCGWGSLVLHAAEHYGVHASGVTLSEAQAQLARERALERGLADRVHIRVADYRELDGEQYDKIASVGMYEHVGREQMGAYVACLQNLVRPGGLVMNHGISQLDSAPRDPRSFIARYVFPNGELQPLSEVVAALAHGGLEVRDVESLREHYALTLRAWVANLRAARPRAERLIGPERVRVWDLYMIGSARAFAAAEISIYQVLAVRNDGPNPLPLNRLELLAERTGHKVF